MSLSFPRGLIAATVLTAAVSGCASQSASKRRPDPAATPSTVTAEDIQRNAPDQPIEKVLAGRVAGVVVSRTSDGGISVRIRGGSSVMGNNEPLYIVDGMAIQAGPGGALSGINPYEIESIRVLKDAAETTMYGSRGANGVIIIKMKKPKQ